MAEPEEQQNDDDGRRRGLIALLVVLLLVGLAFYVGHVLKGASDIQDCAMEGRTNCAPIDTQSK